MLLIGVDGVGLTLGRQGIQRQEKGTAGRTAQDLQFCKKARARQVF